MLHEQKERVENHPARCMDKKKRVKNSSAYCWNEQYMLNGVLSIA
jgi:hypothetical protein